jgi:hypothetical protein
MLAHKRTLKRDKRLIPPIAGSQTFCDNSDVCSYLQDTLGLVEPGQQNVIAYLDNLYHVLYVGDYTVASVNQKLQYLENAVDHITGQVNTTVNDLGSPSGGQTVLTDLTNLKTDANTIESGQTYQNSTFLQPILDALPYPNSQANDVHADINRAIASIILANSLLSLISDALGTAGSVLGTLNTLIGIVFPNHSGGNTTINYNSSLVASGSVPPFDSLVAGSAHPLGAGASVDIPVGTYAYKYSFTVPSYWARQGSFAEDLSPSVAILEFIRDACSFQNPTYVRRECWLAYPLHPAANQFTVDLAPGITGTYTPYTLS